MDHELRKRGTRVAADGARPLSAAEAKVLFAGLASAPALVLAISGGPDSTALLVLAARWRAGRKRGPKLLAVTIDHGLRTESAAEARQVARLARRLGVSHRTLRWTGKKPKTGLQEKAREARYHLLAQAAIKAGASHLLTAHTLDDQAETVLMRFLRGSGVAGLAAMQRISVIPGREQSERTRNPETSTEQASGFRVRGLSAAPRNDQLFLLRPFLDIPKARLIATLRAAGIPFAKDPSNIDPRFTRVRLRALLPALAGEGLDAGRLALLARRMRRAEAALASAVDQAVVDLSLRPWPAAGPIELEARGFAALPTEVGLRLLGRAAAHVGNEGPVELGKLESLHAAVTDKARPPVRFRRTLAGAMVTLMPDWLTVERAPARRGAHNALTTGRRGRHKAHK